MRSFIEKLIRFNTLQIVGISRRDAGDVYYLLKTRKKGTKIEVITMADFSDLSELKSAADSKTPTILVIDGKGVLNKKIDPKNDSDVGWMKNLDYSSVYHTTYNHKGTRFLSFCRKNVAEEEISRLQGSNFEIAACYIGPVISVLLKDGISANSIIAGDSILEFDEEGLSAITKSNEQSPRNYIIGQTTLAGHHLPLYGAAVDFYTHNRSVEKNESPLIHFEEVLYKKAFNMAGILMLGGFFTLLLASYLLTWHYNSENAVLNLKNVYSNESYKQIQELEKQRESKLRILEETGFSSSKFVSFYGYELSKSSPVQIRLSGIDVFPLEKEIKQTEKVSFTTKTILVKGNTYDEAAFNSWIVALKSFAWIDYFEILSLKKDKKDLSHFELKIMLKDV